MTSWPGCTIETLPDGGIRFSLMEPEISWIRIDYQSRLQFGQAELVIETPFLLAANGERYQLDPNDRAQLGPLAALYPDTATDVLMSRNGELSLTFTSGATLTVPPDSQYEAWSLAGFVCVPGGF